ncbi:hypothetical protein B0H66DRAFT_578683 [Apodospora peruviana]|uniref:VWFA domain-containing protein n=1 Tax=Apodospora peruviana TaxID=516989 RepID=A0AAE0HSF5_9PEZI|nr:hypothetical protein B0H66DRAFT_578683 [Apodospora peruviana]
MAKTGSSSLTSAHQLPPAQDNGTGDEDDNEEAEVESPYDDLRDFDTVFLITKICVEHDKDGIDIYFLNHRSEQLAELQKGRSSGGYLCVKSEAEVYGIFKSVQPKGGTQVGRRLRNILQTYLKMYEENEKRSIDSTRLNIIVITDGHPSDKVEDEIKWAAKKARQMHRRICDMGVRDTIDTVTWDRVDGSHTLTEHGILRTVISAHARRAQTED